MLILPVGNISYGKDVFGISHLKNNKGLPYNLSYAKDVVTFTSVSDIYRFGQVDETLYRGGRPDPKQIPELKELGVSTVVDFTTEPFKIAGYTEAEACSKLGIKHVKIPFVSFENPSEENVKKFFDVVEDVKGKNQKMFIHCLEGKDRTGLFVELYKIRYGLSDVQTSINTLLKARYNFSENPLAINFLKDFARKVKP